MKKTNTYISHDCTRKVIMYVDANGHYIVERRVFKDGEWEMVGDRWKYRHFHSAERASLSFIK
jgi:hypothetical protein